MHGEELLVVDPEDWQWPDEWEAVGRGILGMAREVQVVIGDPLS